MPPAALLRIAEHHSPIARRGRAASSAMLLAHARQPASPAPQETTAGEPARTR
ncbi:hypothetical protein AB0Q95_29740 [Streptomyces sp. NPDC059900]|uniref:hypothetical protein n=1 Tax=Streptomyces sp. NPDC059900 TaxID=3155816 RepID=UPI003431F288